MKSEEKFYLIAGPCMAESYEILDAVAAPLSELAQELELDFYFKASFDKANRTSPASYRGPGWNRAKEWFGSLKEKYGCKLLTDVHEVSQVEPVSQVCDGLQIPAFLCRQSDLVVEAARCAQFVNIKKGQFLAPEAMQHIAEKTASEGEGRGAKIALCERGTTFGYGDLVVDMRGLAIMKSFGHPVLFDVTHSTQKPATQGGVSGGLRSMAPILSRAAFATGCLDGAFLEIHPNPHDAKSDAGSQLTIKQGLHLIRQLHALWVEAKKWRSEDPLFV